MSLQIDEVHKNAFHVSGPRWRDNGGSSINIVLVGYTGNGKSATGNSILGGKPFRSIPNACSVTYSCQLASKQLSDGRTINVVDTHGFSDAFSQHKQLSKCFRLVKNKIHAFLLVVSPRSQFSNEAASFRNLQTTFGINFINYVIVVLTGGDDLEDGNTTLVDYLDNSGADPLKDIIRACGNRCILFDNRTKDKLKNDEQVQSLLSLVDTMTHCYGGNHFEPYDLKEDEDNVDAIHVSGPRWNKNYKRAVLACFVKAAYVLELDRQAQRSAQDALAPGWWLPFKFKFLRTLIDPVDGSIIGVILEWDQSERASNNILLSRPSGVPVAVLALRGTLFTSSTRRSDMIHNGCIAFVGSLKSSSRFESAMGELMSLINLYGSRNICVAGHSLGAAFALELAGKVLVKEHKIVEVHAFNPPCPNFHGIFRPVLFDQIVSAWGKLRQRVVSKSDKAQIDNGETIPHVYVNTGDLISAEFQKKPTSSSTNAKLTLVKTKIDNMVTVKLHTVDDENEDGLVAHGLAQWWSNDLKLEIDLFTQINDA